MNDNIDLTKILEGCPKGTKFYSSAFGEIVFQGIIEKYTHPICFKLDNEEDFWYVTSGGKLCDSGIGECIIFPSRTQRDWSKFERFWDKSKVEKFDPNTLKPFDRVLVRDATSRCWKIDFYGYNTNPYVGLISCVSGSKPYCLPYNEETKHLLGTSNDCPEYYKWWEE